MLILKRILLLITLKIAELSGIIFIPYFLGKLANKLMFPREIFGDMWNWGAGVCYIIILLVVLALMLALIDSNWDYVKEKIK